MTPVLPRALRSMDATPNITTNVMAFKSPATPTKSKRNFENISPENNLLTPPNSIQKRRRLDLNNAESYGSLPSPTKTPSPQKLVFGRQSIYSRTKALLQRSSSVLANPSGCLTTRLEQYNKIMNFLETNVENHTSNSLYITGPPGTGKTAQLDSILKNKFLPINLNNPEVSSRKGSNLYNTQYMELPNGTTEQVNITSINCIALKEPSSIFNRIYNAFTTRDFDAPTDQSYKIKKMTDLQHFMESHSKETTFIVVLDEMDKLVRSSLNDTQATRIIFELFLLARLPTVNFLLIGIANSLDMKDKFLSRLNLRQDLLPDTIVFHPYTSDQMFNIIMEKVKDIGECIFNPMAIKFAAKKCSGNTGDLRRLFDVLKNGIEIVELELIAERRKNGIKRSLNNTDINTAMPKVGMQHIAKVFSQVTNGSSTRARINKINMQQRVLLCALVQREKADIFQSTCTLDKAFEYYFKLLNSKDIFKPLNRNEFLEVCTTLESCGLVNTFNGRSTGRTRHIIKLIKTNIDEKEFEEEINKMEILKNFTS